MFVCAVTDFSAEDKAIAASHSARRFIGVQGRESHILENFALPEAQNRTNRPARGPPLRRSQRLSLASEHMTVTISACIDIGLRPSLKTDALVMMGVALIIGCTYSLTCPIN